MMQQHQHQHQQQQQQLAANRGSWSSTGDTTFYDARDVRPDSRFSFTTASEYYDTNENLEVYSNSAYRHDDEQQLQLQQQRQRQQHQQQQQQQTNKKKKKEKRRFRSKFSAHETAVDSTTATEETDDDFGFKFRPAIAPPRPLMQQQQQQQGSMLTLDDTLKMKKSRTEQADARQLPAGSSGILLETNIDLEMDDNSSIPSSYFPRQRERTPTPTQPPTGVRSVPGPVATFTFNTAVKEEKEEEEEETASDVTVGSSATAVPRDEPPQPPAAPWSSTSPTSPSVTVIENRPSPQRHSAFGSVLVSDFAPAPRLPSAMKARLDTDFELDSDLADYRETSPQNLAILQYSRSLEQQYQQQYQQQQYQQQQVAGNYVLAQPPMSHAGAGSVPDFATFVGRDSTIGSVTLRAKSMNTLASSRTSLRSNRALLPPGRARRESLRRSRTGQEMEASLRSLYDQQQSASTARILPPVSAGSVASVPAVASDDGVVVVAAGDPAKPKPQLLACCPCCRDVSRKKLVRIAAVAALVVCCFLLGGAVAWIVLAARPQA